MEKITNKGGRPKLKLNEKQIFELAKIHCTTKEIAAIMDCSVDTLDRRFADLIHKGRQEGKITVRRVLWNVAIKGNVTMLIWLSKNLLGMHEPIIVEPIREEAKGTFNNWFDVTTKR